MKYIYILISMMAFTPILWGEGGFVASKIVRKENISAEKMIVYAYIAFFLLILGYILFISKKISLVNKKLTKLELLHNDNEGEINE